MYAFHLIGLSLIGGAWSWGYIPQCDHLSCSDDELQVCAKLEGTQQRATFDSACEAQRYSCLTGNYWRILYEGACDCPAKCPVSGDPVCAVLDSAERTFHNLCEVLQFTCHTGEPWKVVGNGPCLGDALQAAPLLVPYPQYPVYGFPAYGPLPYGPNLYQPPAYGPPLAYPSPYAAALLQQPYRMSISREALPASNPASNTAPQATAGATDKPSSDNIPGGLSRESGFTTESVTDSTSASSSSAEPSIGVQSQVRAVAGDPLASPAAPDNAAEATSTTGSAATTPNYAKAEKVESTSDLPSYSNPELASFSPTPSDESTTPETNPPTDASTNTSAAPVLFQAANAPVEAAESTTEAASSSSSDSYGSSSYSPLADEKPYEASLSSYTASESTQSPSESTQSPPESSTEAPANATPLLPIESTEITNAPAAPVLLQAANAPTEVAESTTEGGPISNSSPADEKLYEEAASSSSSDSYGSSSYSPLADEKFYEAPLSSYTASESTQSPSESTQSPSESTQSPPESSTEAPANSTTILPIESTETTNDPAAPVLLQAANAPIEATESTTEAASNSSSESTQKPLESPNEPLANSTSASTTSNEPKALDVSESSQSPAQEATTEASPESTTNTAAPLAFMRAAQIEARPVAIGDADANQVIVQVSGKDDVQTVKITNPKSSASPTYVFLFLAKDSAQKVDLQKN